MEAKHISGWKKYEVQIQYGHAVLTRISFAADREACTAYWKSQFHTDAYLFKKSCSIISMTEIN